MATQVDASTANAGQLFATTYFEIPDFQRDYSWSVREQVSDFWRDLHDALDAPPYFLGLLILTDEQSKKSVVDGQQRIITLSLLSNAIRRAALKREKRLVADSMRDTFLFGLDFETETRAPRLAVSAERDRNALEAVLGYSLPTGPINEKITQAQAYLDQQIEMDLDQHEESSRLGKWARLVSNGLTFAVFDHPTRNSAYKVYEIVNTRGRDLTPTDLIKSYLIGTVAVDSQPDVVRRWNALEESFLKVRAGSQFTQFVRHVVTLRHGYVIPRDLYQEINDRYPDQPSVDRLLKELEAELALYMLFVDRTADTDVDDITSRAFALLDTAGLTTVRPIFMAAAKCSNPDDALVRLLRIVLPRLVVGSFGTGSIERQFAEAARQLHADGDPGHIDALEDLKPPREEFRERVLERAFPRGVALVLRLSALQHSAVPDLDGYLHQLRAGNAVDWDEFPDVDFRQAGGLIGNYVVATTERRPRGTNNPAAVLDRLLTLQVPEELFEPNDFIPWTAARVHETTLEIATRALDVWYG